MNASVTDLFQCQSYVTAASPPGPSAGRDTGTDTVEEIVMNGARWGWLALVGAVAVLFAASSQNGSGHVRAITSLRQDVQRVTQQRDQVLAQRDDARQLAGDTQDWADLLQTGLDSAEHEVRQLKAEREALRSEVARLALDRGQLQQNIVSLQQERAQTRRNVEQLRHGLHQLLSQAETVTTALAQPAPGPASAVFVDETTEPVLVRPPAATGTIYGDEPLNKKQ